MSRLNGTAAVDDELAIAYGKDVSLQTHAGHLVQKHGGYRAAARVLKVDHGYLYRLHKGYKKDPSPALLRRMGLKRVVYFVRIRRNA